MDVSDKFRKRSPAGHRGLLLSVCEGNGGGGWSGVGRGKECVWGVRCGGGGVSRGVPRALQLRVTRWARAVAHITLTWSLRNFLITSELASAATKDVLRL